MHSSCCSARIHQMLRYSNPGASARFFPSVDLEGQRRMNDGQKRFATAERDLDLAARGDVVGNKVEHLFQDAKCVNVCFIKVG